MAGFLKAAVEKLREEVPRLRASRGQREETMKGKLFP